MVKDFFKDLNKGRRAEQIVASALSNLGYDVADVSDNRSFFYKGDLLITLPSGEKKFVEVKNDSRIADTRNILCEEEVYYKDSDYYGKGNMQSDYEIYSVVSQEENKIYFLNFEVMKSIYKKFGDFKAINHYDQITYCYLLSLSDAIRCGALLGELTYCEEARVAA